MSVCVEIGVLVLSGCMCMKLSPRGAKLLEWRECTGRTKGRRAPYLPTWYEGTIKREGFPPGLEFFSL